MTERTKLFTLQLTPYQHRMLRDLVWWAAHDIRKGPDGAAPFWSNNVMDEDWDESIATMQAISASLEPKLRPLTAPLEPGAAQEVLGDEGIGGAEFTPEACAAEKKAEEGARFTVNVEPFNQAMDEIGRADLKLPEAGAR